MNVLSVSDVAYIPLDQVDAHMTNGALVRVVEAWCPKQSVYHQYFASRRRPSPAFALVLDALSYEPGLYRDPICRAQDMMCRVPERYGGWSAPRIRLGWAPVSW